MNTNEFVSKYFLPLSCKKLDQGHWSSTTLYYYNENHLKKLLNKMINKSYYNLFINTEISQENLFNTNSIYIYTGDSLKTKLKKRNNYINYYCLLDKDYEEYEKINQEIFISNLRNKNNDFINDLKSLNFYTEDFNGKLLINIYKNTIKEYFDENFFDILLMEQSRELNGYLLSIEINKITDEKLYKKYIDLIYQKFDINKNTILNSVLINIKNNNQPWQKEILLKYSKNTEEKNFSINKFNILKIDLNNNFIKNTNESISVGLNIYKEILEKTEFKKLLSINSIIRQENSLIILLNNSPTEEKNKILNDFLEKNNDFIMNNYKNIDFFQNVNILLEKQKINNIIDIENTNENNKKSLPIKI